MNSTRSKSRLMVAAALLGTGLWALLFAGRIADAHPPPPPQYTVTVNKQGGDTCCKVRISLPEPATAWTSGSVQGTYVSNAYVKVEAKRDCPCPYSFDVWFSNETQLNGTVHEAGYFYINKDTQATAVFDPIIVPDRESTTWKEHWTTAPHWGDEYDHTVSLSTDPSHSFQAMTINEDFLTSDMTTSGWTLSEADKKTFETDWDGNWDIMESNGRNVADVHQLDPNTAPFNAMPDGGTFQIIQRMRVDWPCLSDDLLGPYFASHVILFKLIVNPQTLKREIFVKKDDKQGDGDPAI